jgi:hypothetical protein
MNEIVTASLVLISGLPHDRNDRRIPEQVWLFVKVTCVASSNTSATDTPEGG